MKKYISDNRPIGVFDSGLGGLTVVAALRRRFPAEEILYLGDTARVPYGDKSTEAITQFARQDLDFLMRRGVKLAVAACNTVSAVALDSLRESHPDEHLIGVIEAGVRQVIRSGARRVAVIGTRATINSDAYRRGIHAADRSIVVESFAAPLLVPLAEEGVVDGDLARGVLELYLGPLRGNPPDALLLGCTHYPLFIPAINAYFEGRVKLIDSAGACAEFAADYITERHLAAAPEQTGRIRSFVTDRPSEFHTLAMRFLGGDPGRVDEVRLADCEKGK